jgi:hypothetical protein
MVTLDTLRALHEHDHKLAQTKSMVSPVVATWSVLKQGWLAQIYPES